MRGRLYVAAMQVFAETGFEKARMEHVAEAAGVSRGTLYYHFRTKDDLFRFAFHHGMELHAAYLRERVDEVDDPRARLDALVDAFVDFYSEHRDFTRVAIVQATIAGASGDLAPLAMLAEVADVAASVLDDARAAGLLQDLDRDLCLNAFLGLMASVPMFTGGRVSRGKNAELKRTLRTIYLRGVLAPA